MLFRNRGNGTFEDVTEAEERLVKEPTVGTESGFGYRRLWDMDEEQGADGEGRADEVQNQQGSQSSLSASAGCQGGHVARHP